MPNAFVSFEILRALRHRAYRLYFFGHGTSLCGTWMHKVALNWLVYRITGSAFMLGVVHFAALIPTFFVAPWAGVFADRLDRRRLLIATQVLSTIHAFALAAIAASPHPSVTLIIVLAVLHGFVNAFDIPARQSLMAEIVSDRDDLGNAIALNSLLVNGARLAGPSAAGILIALSGESVCFGLNGLSYLAVIASLVAIGPLRPPPSRNPEPAFAGFKEGLSYAASSVPIRHLLFLLATVSTLGVSYTVLLPVFASEVLHGGPKTLGFLTAATGLGALFGALYLASRKNVVGLLGVVAAAAMSFGATLCGFAFSTNLCLSLCLLAVAGFAMMVHLAGNNTLLQTIADDDKRGRIMGLYTMAFMGMTPFGNLLAGGLASVLGPEITLLICGGALAAGAVVFAFRLPAVRRAVRPVYVERGIVTAHGPDSRIL
ncbi:MAG: MFS transporter [Deltaproteobacteria bacterium]|nr:MFS transporter [Deltaproteobacteria bacterium]